MRNRFLLGICGYCLGVSTVFAQLPDPALDFVFPAGGQVGSTVTVQVGGRDLDDAHSLIFSHPGLRGRIDQRAPGEFEEGPQPVPNQFRIEIPANLAPGAYEVRTIGRFGLSSPRTFVVGRESEQSDSSDNHQPATAVTIPIDSVINGRTDGGAVDYYRLSARAGQLLVISCAAQQIDSLLQPVVTVWNADGKQLGRTTQTLDPVLPLEIPSDGDYIVGIHDRVFAGGATHAYRLRIVSGPYVVAVEPASALPGQQVTLTVHGLHLPGTPGTSPWKLGAHTLQQTTIPLFVPERGESLSASSVLADAEGFVYRGAGEQHSLEVPVLLASLPVTAEIEPNQTPDTAQQISIPTEVSGRFYPRRDQDWVAFAAKAGQRFQVRVLSQRLGLPTDAEVFIQKAVKDASGQVHVTQVSTDDDFRANDQRYRQALRRGLDVSHHDPSISFAADQDAEYRVGLRDLGGSSLDDPRLVYRLLIESQQPDFRLLSWVQRQAVDDDKKIDPAGWSIRPGGTLSVQLDVVRRGGFDGPIQVTAEGLPAGISSQPSVVAAGQTEGTLVLSASQDTAAWTGPIQILGTAAVEGQPVQRYAQGATLLSATGNIEATRPAGRAMRDLVLSVAAEDKVPARIDLGNPDDRRAVWRTSLGGKLSIPVKYTKFGEVKGDLVLVPIGLPAEVKGANVTLAAGADSGQLELTLDSNKPVPGTYTIWLRGKVPVSYARHPQAIERLAAHRQTLNGTLQQIAEETAATDAKLAEAQQQLAGKAEQLAQVQNAYQASVKSLEVAAQQLADARQQLATVQSLTSQQQNEALAALVKQADEVTGTMTDQLAAVRSPLDALGTKIGELQGSLDTARGAVAAAEQRKKELAEKKTRADEYIKGLDQRLAEAQANLGPKDVTIYLDSTPCTLEIIPAPLAVNVSRDSLALQAGQEAMIDVQLERLFGFADKVTLQWEVPDGLDLKGEPVEMAAAQSQAAIKLVAGPQLAKGKHVIPLRMSLQFNGVDLQHRIPVTVQVE